MQMIHASIGCNADVAQLVEQLHGKEQVAGSIPAVGSRIKLNCFFGAEILAALRAA